MASKTEFSLDFLFPDLEDPTTSQASQLPESSRKPLTIHDIIKLTLSLEEVVDKQAARRMLLHHVEPPLKSYIPKMSQDVPLDLKLAQIAAVQGDIPRLQRHLAEYLKEAKLLKPVFILEEQERRIH